MINITDKSVTKARFASWVFAVICIILALAPGIKEIIYGKPATEYSPDVAILTATLLTIIAYVYWTYLAVTIPLYEKRKLEITEKTSLASALLSELQLVDKTLRWIYQGATWSYDPLEYPFLELACKNLHLFTPKTVHALGVFYGRLRDVRKHFMSKDVFLMKSPELLKCKAQMACVLGCELVIALREEGGINPPPLTEVNFNKDNLPELPPQVFANPNQVYTYDRENALSSIMVAQDGESSASHTP